MEPAAGGVVVAMKKLITIAAATTLAVALASCGGSSKQSSASTPSTASTANKVLMDSNGLAVYTPDGETASNVRCTGGCLSIWKPLRPGGLTGGDAGKLAVITRPDGSKQVAVAGKPLYTFAEDTPGSVTGNGTKDAFGGKSFTWHAVKAGGAAAAAPASKPSGGGYGNGGY
jgi:predicted lipoprotein with Yx(FWY)xxD motif